jgi:hypothetical protein
MQGPTVFSASGIAFSGLDTGALGDNRIGSAFDPSVQPVVSRTLDGGQTWETLRLPAPPELPAASDDPYAQWCGTLDLKAAAPELWHATVACRVGDAASRQMLYFLYRTWDRGETWQSMPVAGYQAPDLWGRWRVVTASAAFAGGEGLRLVTRESDDLSELWRSPDGGWTWDRIKIVDWQSARFDLVDSQSAWAIAVIDEESTLMRTTDGGWTWQDLEPVIRP